jgi:hypothetical protein
MVIEAIIAPGPKKRSQSRGFDEISLSGGGIIFRFSISVHSVR